MRYETDGRVGDALEGLVQKIEKLNREKNEEIENTRRALASMDRLTEAMTLLHRQKRREKILASRMAYIHEQLEKAASGSHRDSIETKGLTDAINKLLSGAKATGQIIEIVAGSLMVMVETVRNVIKSQSAGTRGYTPSGEARGVDLAALLKPINILLNSLVAKNQAPSTPAESKDSEVVEGQHLKKEESNPVPVVKAVPASEKASQENS